MDLQLRNSKVHPSQRLHVTETLSKWWQRVQSGGKLISLFYQFPFFSTRGQPSAAVSLLPLRPVKDTAEAD